MKRKYIVIYTTGYTDVIMDKKIKSSKDLKEIQDGIEKDIKRNINIINYKYVGLVWK